MTLEQLIAMGLSEEVAKKVLEAYQASLKDKFIPIERFNEVNETKKDLEKQINERDKQLKDLGEKVKGNEAAEKTIKDLQDANKKTKDDYEAKLKDLTITAAIQSKLVDTKYPDLLASKFDKSKIIVGADGTVSGIDEQITALKETYKDLFVPKVKGKDPNNKGDGSSDVKNPWSKEHFNLTKQGQLLKEDPELAKQLIAAAK